MAVDLAGRILGPIIGLVVVGLLFAPLERKWPLVRRRLLRPGWRTDVAHFLFTGVLAGAAGVAGIVAAWLLVGWWAPASLHAAVGGQPVALQLVQVFILGNLIGYWAHRLSHEVPFLWRFHKVHHSSTHLDWLAAARRHPLEEAWNGLLVGVPLIFLGFQVQQVAALQAIQVIYAIFLHANVRWRLPGLRHVIATPEFHHWHHSDDPEHYNTNYSLFPWLDALFGTRYQPDHRARTFGVPGYEAGGYLRQMKEPFRRRPKATSAPPAPAATTTTSLSWDEFLRRR
ncbi:MAG: sterol desaturase family protein [Thermoplasmatota archaeon]